MPADPARWVLLLGIGQTLRGDDGVGMAALQQWMLDYPEHTADPRLRVEIAPTPGIDLLRLLEGYLAAILVDATRSGAPAGTVQVLTRAQLTAPGSTAPSTHAWGITETLQLGAELQLAALPEELVLVGIEGVDFSMGAPLSPPVAAALPAAVREIEAQVSRLLEKTAH